jgi:hypothetical protein
MTESFHDAAVAYHRAGWQVFPCRNKAPLIKWEYIQTERLTESAVSDWWRKWPDAQIALACGELSGVTVIDVDWLKDPGTKEILFTESVPPAELAAGLPMTMRSVTGTKGIHCFFRFAPIRNSVKSIHPQLDVRSNGGYVILPPSVHENGRTYEWDSLMPFSETNIAGLASVPKDIVDISMEEMAEGKDFVKLMKGVGKGARNDTMSAMIGKFLWMDDPYLAWEVSVMMNQRNNPPLEEWELKKTFTSILKKDYAKRPWVYRKDAGGG